MTEYLFSLFGLSALLGALSLVRYDRDGASATASRILFGAAVLLPIFDTVMAFSSPVLPLPPATEGEIGEYAELARAAFIDGTRRAVCDKFSLSEDCVEVDVLDFDFKKMRAGKIKITLSGRAIIADGRAIVKFIESEGLGECEVRLRV